MRSINIKEIRVGPTHCNKGRVPRDYEKMSNPELYSLLKEKVPAVAETVRGVSDSNRERVIAFLKFLADDSR